MSEVAIRVEGLGKQYKIGKAKARYGSFRESITETLSSPFKRFRQNGSGHNGSNGSTHHSSPITHHSESADSTIWALKDVSFSVKRGEVVGIIGRNGAGKSTLLKILSRITEPTEGAVDIYGRVGSLLEVGTGFHYDLTGRENIFLNGAILGMSAAEVGRKFDRIVSFAEIQQFIDTPVKKYSSGMHMRLAFAIAAFLEPDILLVDEVLAVGDLQFQKKCLGRIGEVSKEGRTVIFVSHDMRTIRNLCNEGIYLRAGRVAMNGQIEETISGYAADCESSCLDLPFRNDDLIVRQFEISQTSMKTNHIDGSLPFRITTEFELLRDMTLFRLGVYVKTPLGDTVTRSLLADWNPERETLRAGSYEAVLEFPANLLFPGLYSVILHSSRYGLVDYLPRADIRHDITVVAPSSYNEAHPGENNYHCSFLVRDPWGVARIPRSRESQM